MSGVVVTSFGGVVPRLGSRLLQPNAGQKAVNLKVFSGELRSWKKPSLINTPAKGGNLASMYRMYSGVTDYWLSWTDDVDVVKGPIAGDTAFKIYYTGDTTTATDYAAGPRKTSLALTTSGTGSNYPNDFLEMGVPAPGSGPAVIGTGGTSTVSESRVYLYTYVTSTASWAEEGPPSPLGTGTGKSDATWVISSLSTGTTGKYQFGGGIKRVYRTLTDNAGNTNYQLALDNVPMATTSTDDTVANADLGVICPTFILGVVNSEWVAPPSDLKGLTAMPNGMMVGFSGNQVCFAEPFFPHAWPIRYRLSTEFDIVSLGVYGQTVIVTTKGFPYAVSGARPDSMAMNRIEEVHPCVSKRSTVSFPFGVAWATPDGLALAGVGGTVNVIEPFMKRDEWRDLCFPDTIIARQYLNTYFGFFNDGTEGQNFIFDKSNQLGPLVFGNYSVQGTWFDPETAKLYLLMNGGIYEWDADSNNNSPFDWKSKTFVLPKPVNMGALIVDADYDSLAITTDASAVATADIAVNTSILGTGAADTANLIAWSASSSYGIGTAIKSVNGHRMAICLTAGTSSSTEFAYPDILGASATDGTVVWKQIWEITGVTKGSLRGHVLRNHTQYTTADPFFDGTAGVYRWGFPLRGGLETEYFGGDAVGTGTAGLLSPNYDNRGLLVQVYAISTATNSGTTLVNQQYLTTREPVRLPRGFKSDTWEVRLSGNINVRYFKVAETVRELNTLS